MSGIQPLLADIKKDVDRCNATGDEAAKKQQELEAKKKEQEKA